MFFADVRSLVCNVGSFRSFHHPGPREVVRTKAVSSGRASAVSLPYPAGHGGWHMVGMLWTFCQVKGDVGKQASGLVIGSLELELGRAPETILHSVPLGADWARGRVSWGQGPEPSFQKFLQQPLNVGSGVKQTEILTRASWRVGLQVSVS